MKHKYFSLKQIFFSQTSIKSMTRQQGAGFLGFGNCIKNTELNKAYDFYIEKNYTKEIPTLYDVYSIVSSKIIDYDDRNMTVRVLVHTYKDGVLVDEYFDFAYLMNCVAKKIKFPGNISDTEMTEQFNLLKQNIDYKKKLQTSKGGAMTKVHIGKKQCTTYVKINGEFVTVAKAQKMAHKSKKK